MFGGVRSADPSRVTAEPRLLQHCCTCAALGQLITIKTVSSRRRRRRANALQIHTKTTSWCLVFFLFSGKGKGWGNVTKKNRNRPFIRNFQGCHSNAKVAVAIDTRRGLFTVIENSTSFFNPSLSFCQVGGTDAQMGAAFFSSNLRALFVFICLFVGWDGEWEFFLFFFPLFF